MSLANQIDQLLITELQLGTCVSTRNDYLAKQPQAEHPFAEYRYKTDSRVLWMDYAQFEAIAGDRTLLVASQHGQLAWSDIIGKLQEFDYEDDGIAVRWHVVGVDQSVMIDPRIQFGAPAVEDVATWVYKGRWEAGEPLDEIADDFGISNSAVLEASRFEGVEPDLGKATRH
jgi:uncharacterized protein (DUF433 family)